MTSIITIPDGEYVRETTRVRLPPYFINNARETFGFDEIEKATIECCPNFQTGQTHYKGTVTIRLLVHQTVIHSATLDIKNGVCPVVWLNFPSVFFGSRQCALDATFMPPRDNHHATLIVTGKYIAHSYRNLYFQSDCLRWKDKLYTRDHICNKVVVA